MSLSAEVTMRSRDDASLARDGNLPKLLGFFPTRLRVCDYSGCERGVKENDHRPKSLVNADVRQVQDGDDV